MIIRDCLVSVRRSRLKIASINKQCQRLHSQLHKLHPSNALLDLSTHNAPLPPPSSLTILPDFFTTNEQELLIASANKKLRSLCGKEYWTGHFDGVIESYRECTVRTWSGGHPDSDTQIVSLLERVKLAAEESSAEVETESVRKPGKWLDPHVLDLKAGGEIRAHVDNLQASGSIITGVCLVSDAVAVFRHKDDANQYFKALLPAGCVYIQRDALRYSYTHEFPKDETLRSLKGRFIAPDRRISILLRNQK
ncbi:hypothetical protein DFS34DRAFT_37238 [Phlyctochytrium arcticum]|nr:hypothetical protein DFS34DRAFT_37238 [Phlyctochytrium arcticum]